MARARSSSRAVLNDHVTVFSRSKTGILAGIALPLDTSLIKPARVAKFIACACLQQIPTLYKLYRIKKGRRKSAGYYDGV